MSFTTFWYEALPFNISYCSDELSEYSRHSSCLRYFPCCVRRHLYFFPSRRQGCWEGNSRVSVLHSPYTISVVAVICFSFSAVVRDYCSISLKERGDLELVKPTYLRLWLLISPVQMQGSTQLQFSDPPGCLCRLRTQLGSGTSSSISLKT